MIVDVRGCSRILEGGDDQDEVLKWFTYVMFFHLFMAFGDFMVQYWIEMIYITQRRLLRDSVDKENAIGPSAVVGKDPPLTESPEALTLELLHVGLEVVLVLSIVVQVTLPSQ